MAGSTVCTLRRVFERVLAGPRRRTSSHVAVSLFVQVRDGYLARSKRRHAGQKPTERATFGRLLPRNIRDALYNRNQTI